MSATHPIKVVVDRSQATRDLAALQAQLNGVGNAANDMSRRLSGANDNTRTFGDRLTQAADKTKVFGLSLRTIGIGVTAAVAALVGLAVAATKVTAEFQSLKASLAVATGGMANASAEFARLQRFAAATPFSTKQAVEGFIKLKNLGLDPTERAMKSYGNTAASMGKTMMDMVEAVADASTGEMERLKEFGITSQKEGEKVKLTFAGVTTTVANNSKAIQKYLIELGETKFGDAMELQARTLGGVMSTLEDTMSNLLYKMGEGFAGALFTMAEGLSTGAENMEQLAVSAGRLIGQGLNGLINGFQFVAKHAETFGTILKIGVTYAVAGFATQVVAAAVPAIASMIAGLRTLATTGTLATGALTALSRVGVMALVYAIGSAIAQYISFNQTVDAVNKRMADNKKRMEDAKKATDGAKTSTVEAGIAASDAITGYDNFSVSVKNLTDKLWGQADAAKQARIQMAALRLDEAKKEERDAFANTQSGAIAGIRNNTGLSRLGALGSAALQSTLNTIDKILGGDRATQAERTWAQATKNAIEAELEYRKALESANGPKADGSGSGSGSGDSSKGLAADQRWKTREESIIALGKQLKADGARVDGNTAFGYTGGHANNAYHNRYKIDVNRRAGDDAADPLTKAQNDRDALMAQKAGYRVLWNGYVYEPGGPGPSSRIRGKNKHTSHMDIEAVSDLSKYGRNGVSSNLDLAEQELRSVEALAEKKKTADELITSQQKEAELAQKSVRERQLENAELKIKQHFGEDWSRLSAAEQAAYVERAKAAAQANMEADAARIIKEQNLALDQQSAALEAERKAILTGDKTLSEQMLKDAESQKRVMELTNQLYETGAYATKEMAENAARELEARRGIVNAQAEANAAMARIMDADKEARKRNDPLGYQIGEQKDALSSLERDYIKARNELLAKGDAENLKRLEAAYARVVKDMEAQYFEANRAMAADMAAKFSQAFQTLGNALAGLIGGKTGQKIGGVVGGLGNILGLVKGGLTKGADGKAIGLQLDPNATEGIAGVANGLIDINSKLGELFGKGGELFKGLNGILGQAGAGAQMGSQIAPLMKALGIKTSNTGAQIGGALGNIAGSAIGGPIGGMIGSAIGSIAGGLLGGLFKKKPAPGKASVGFDMYGNLSATAQGGGDSKWQGQATEIANAIVSGINNITQALGGYLDPTSGFKLNVKKKSDYFINGKEIKMEADAIAYGIKQALMAGVITGISDFSARILKTATATNLDGLVGIAASYEKILDALDAIENPLTGGITQFIKDLDRLVQGMTAAGATTEELGNVQRYRELALKKMLEENLSGLQQFKKDLSGAGSGVTALNRLNADLAEFNLLKADIAAGKTVDQEKFLELGQNIFSLAGEVYGTSTSAFQAIRQMLMQATDGLIENVTNSFNDAVLEAMQTQTVATEVTNSHLVNTNETLHKIHTALIVIANNTAADFNANGRGTMNPV